MFDNAEVISRYTRKQAIEDGILVDLSTGETKRLVGEAGIKYPVAMTATSWNATVGLGGKWVADPENEGGEVMELPVGQDAIGRTWDVLWMLKCAVTGLLGREAKHLDATTLVYPVRVWDGKRTRKVMLKSACGPNDDGSPCIIVMLPWCNLKTWTLPWCGQRSGS
jgi:hypothetical protein